MLLFIIAWILSAIYIIIVEFFFPSTNVFLFTLLLVIIALYTAAFVLVAREDFK